MPKSGLPHTHTPKGDSSFLASVSGLVSRRAAVSEAAALFEYNMTTRRSGYYTYENSGQTGSAAPAAAKGRRLSQSQSMADLVNHADENDKEKEKATAAAAAPFLTVPSTSDFDIEVPDPSLRSKPWWPEENDEDSALSERSPNDISQGVGYVELLRRSSASKSEPESSAAPAISDAKRERRRRSRSSEEQKKKEAKVAAKKKKKEKKQKEKESRVQPLTTPERPEVRRNRPAPSTPSDRRMVAAMAFGARMFIRGFGSVRGQKCDDDEEDQEEYQDQEAEEDE